MLKKRGYHTGGQAAVVVGIIALILIFYVMFLPPEDREALLAEEEDNGGIEVYEGINKTILEVNQLRLTYIGDDEAEHVIPNIHLRQTTAANEFARETPFYIRNGWFDKKTRTIDFEIDNPENTLNLLISLEAPKRKGRLMIFFNDEIVYDFEASKLNIGPIEINNKLLKKENQVRVEVSGVGLAFWRTNEYAIEEFKVVGDITDTKTQESLNSFTVEKEEMYNFESGYIKFWPVCDPADVGRLDVFMNNKMIYSSVPDCNSINRQDIFGNDLNAGKNTLVFKTTRGSYRLEQIKVKTYLKPERSYLEYFDVNETQYEAVQDNDLDAVLEIEFVDDDENKKADVNINGHLTRIDQEGAFYDRDISTWIEEGARNYVEITPLTTLNIVEMSVRLEET